MLVTIPIGDSSAYFCLGKIHMIARSKFLPEHRVAQRGINMVDLMMWLVIAALLLAAAIQGIGYYQQAAYAYHAKSDLMGAHQWVSASHANNSKLPGVDDFNAGIANGDLSLTSVSGTSNIGLMAINGQKYCIGIKSPLILDLQRNVFYSTSDDPANIIRDSKIPSTCGNVIAFAPSGTDTSTSVSPATTPVVTGSVLDPTTAQFTWTAVSGAVSYRVETQTNGGDWVVKIAANTSTTATITASGGDVINARVTAVNPAGESPSSVPVTVTLPPTMPSAFAAWGYNTSSQLNVGTAVNMASPTSVLQNGALAGKKISYVESGADHSCALAEGHVYCWGYGGYGNIGNGSNSNQPAPVEIDMTAIGTRTITALSVNEIHDCLIASGVVYCWGHGGSGKLGNGATGGVFNTPQQVGGLIAGKTVTYITTASNMTCAIADGAPYCWGYNYYGQVGSGDTAAANVPVAVNTTGALSGKTVTKIAVYGQSTCALASGSIYCWGSSFTLVPSAFDPTGLLSGKTITALEAGGTHACVLANGKPYCWGSGSAGQLGNGDTTNYYTTAVNADPYGATDRRTVTALSLGGTYSCMIASGVPFCWGENTYYSLGTGDSSWAYSPTKVDVSGVLAGKTAMTLAAGVKGVFVGYSNIAPPADAVTSFSATSFATAGWGNNSNGKLGNGTTTASLVPTNVLNNGALTGKKVSKVAVSSTHACAIANGEVYCWGDNPTGAFGNKTTSGSTLPIKTYSDGWLRGRTVTDLSVGPNFTCAVAEGKAYCWGVNNMGQTGNDPNGFYWKAPVPVDTSGVLSGKTVTAVSSGGSHACAVADGAAYCWGYNNEGELGNNTTTGSRFPTAVVMSGVLAGKTVTGIDAGGWGTCVVASGNPYCWGWGQYGQNGNNSGASSSVPVAVDTSVALNGLTTIKVDRATYFTCALASNQRVYCWGFNSGGELGNSSAGAWSTVPIGTNPSGLMAGKNVTALGVGDSHTCAIADGSTYCWGQESSEGRLGNNTTSGSGTPVLVDQTGVLSGVTPQQIWSGGDTNFIGY